MAIIGSHSSLAFIFGILGNVISFMVYLAPLPTFYRIYKRKSTEGFQSLPYLVALFSSMLWLYYALLKKGAMLLITINSFGFVIEIIYITMFIIYAPKDPRRLTIRLFGAMNIGSFALILLVIRFAVPGSIRVTVLGWICVAVSVSVFAAPLSIMAQVIRTRSVQFMPFTLSFFLTLSAVMWFAYGLFLKDICIALPNVVGFTLGLLQMVLYAVYRKGGDTKQKQEEVVIAEEKEKEKEKERSASNIVVMNPLGAREVFPIAVDDVNQQPHHQKNGNNYNSPV